MQRKAYSDLVLEGEKLCNKGSFRTGITYLEASIRLGISDAKTLSKTYSHLGNAYYHLKQYAKAMEYYKSNLSIARAMEDELEEGIACSHISNILKARGRYDEAILYCKNHLAISRKLNNEYEVGRALSILGSVHLVKSKRYFSQNCKEPNDLPEEMKFSLFKAIRYFESSLKIMRVLEDQDGVSKACHGLGISNYLIGNLEDAVLYYEERLEIARKCGDKAVELMVLHNLGNAHTILEEHEIAIEHYKKSLQFAIDMQDRAFEAHVNCSLGYVHFVMKDYPSSLTYFLRGLEICQEIEFKECGKKAYQGLADVYSAIGSDEKASYYKIQGLMLSKEEEEEEEEKSSSS